MIRTASGETIVVVTASGLTPGETYWSHVHKQSYLARRDMWQDSVRRRKTGKRGGTFLPGQSLLRG